ncbi:hypothetical protein KXW14_007137, partial [Aspergillus fumigatus]
PFFTIFPLLFQQFLSKELRLRVTQQILATALTTSPKLSPGRNLIMQIFSNNM